MMRRPLRVLYVLNSLGMGGAETWLMTLVRHWARTGDVEVEFLLTDGSRDVFDAEAGDLGARLHYLPYSRAKLVRFIPAYRRLLADGHYDAIHDHSDYSGGLKLAFGLGLLPKVRIAHVHNPWLHITANYAVSPLRRLTAALGKWLIRRLATHVLGTSTHILRQYGFEPGLDGRPKVLTLHCGIDVDRFAQPRAADRAAILAEFGWPREAKLILFAGRIDRSMEFDHPQNHKNSWFALNVALAAARVDPSVRLIMAGAGEGRDSLAAKIIDWELADRLVLAGVRTDMDRLMRAADLLLFPSRQEGLGMVAVEAQATGLPVLASTAVPDEACVIPSIYHTLPLTDSVDSWAMAALAIMAEGRLDVESSRQAVAVSAFSAEISAKRLVDVYSGDL